MEDEKWRSLECERRGRLLVIINSSSDLEMTEAIQRTADIFEDDETQQMRGWRG